MSLDGNTVQGPRICARPGRIVREPGLLTLEELFATFLDEGEATVENGSRGRWKIVRGKQLPPDSSKSWTRTEGPFGTDALPWRPSPANSTMRIGQTSLTIPEVSTAARVYRLRAAAPSTDRLCSSARIENFENKTCPLESARPFVRAPKGNRQK